MSLAYEMRVAWAAGLFEGEGSAGSQGRIGTYGYQSGRLFLGMKDEETVREFARVMGAGKIYKRNTGSAVWAWQTTNRRDFRRCVALLYPWMTTRRKQRMLEVLRAYMAPSVPHIDRWNRRRKDACQ